MDGGSGDSTISPESGSDADAASNSCAVFGAPGECIDMRACTTLTDPHTPYPGPCPGPASMQCCIDTPDTADNPAVPAGWTLMQQSMVTTAMSIGPPPPSFP